MLSDGATSFLCGVLVLRPFVGELMLKRLGGWGQGELGYAFQSIQTFSYKISWDLMSSMMNVVNNIVLYT